MSPKDLEYKVKKILVYMKMTIAFEMNLDQSIENGEITIPE